MLMVVDGAMLIVRGCVAGMAVDMFVMSAGGHGDISPLLRGPFSMLMGDQGREIMMSGFDIAP